MTDTPPVDLIRYDILTQNALRGVVKNVLEEVRDRGLPGDHHFFITFDTTAKGVRLSNRMLEKYPEEMTIVIQHTFWNLEISDTGFEIDLSFDEIHERLKIPFQAIKAFFDPSVKFGLQFDVTQDALSEEESETVSDLPVPAESREISSVENTKKKTAEPKGAESPEDAETNDADENSTAEVVSLDSFRKKK